MNCRQVSRLVSDGLDRRLALHERLAVWIHLLYCRACAAYRRQVLMLREAARSTVLVADPGVPLSGPPGPHEPLDDAGGVPEDTLSPEARRRIHQALLDAPPPPE
ncbi:MAG: hypothetical protein FLDDKLPJ_00876 [Phycisphaerae bacterium]|nr:hypothetical protein [Phycisphaerae bacterium]